MRYDDMWQSTDGCISWSQVTFSGAQWSARYSHGAAFVENKIILFGGFSTG